MATGKAVAGGEWFRARLEEVGNQLLVPSDGSWEEEPEMSFQWGGEPNSGVLQRKYTRTRGGVKVKKNRRRKEFRSSRHTGALYK